MRFVVYVEMEEDGSAMAHVPALPGCVSTGLNQEVAVGRIEQAIRDYYQWLHQHGEQVPAQIDPVELEIGGISSDAGHPGDAASFFPSDRAPLTDQEVATLLRLMHYSRQDLMSLVSGMASEVLNWKPSVENGQEAWDISDVLEHISTAEQFYLTRLSTNVLAMLQDSRNTATERLANLSVNERSQIAEHAGELWSARKVFRRFLEHEREHIRHVEDVLDRYNATQGLR